MLIVSVDMPAAETHGDLHRGWQPDQCACTAMKDKEQRSLLLLWQDAILNVESREGRLLEVFMEFIGDEVGAELTRSVGDEDLEDLFRRVCEILEVDCIVIPGDQLSSEHIPAARRGESFADARQRLFSTNYFVWDADACCTGDRSLRSICETEAEASVRCLLGLSLDAVRLFDDSCGAERLPLLRSFLISFYVYRIVHKVCAGMKAKDDRAWRLSKFFESVLETAGSRLNCLWTGPLTSYQSYLFGEE